jgi:hypothetical protein
LHQYPSQSFGVTVTLPWRSAQRSDRRNDRRNFKLSELYPTSTPHHTTNISRIEEALAAIESLDEGEHFTYTNIANTYGVSRVTLARRHQGIQASRTEQAVKQQLLNPQQELELVKYITRLTEDGLPPTRNMIQSFASEIIKGEVGNEWVTRFIHRNEENLITKWTSGMDRNRHEADSG